MKLNHILSFIFTSVIVTSIAIATISHASQVTKDVNCLALNIYHEARGEPIAGQIAVAQVTMNRVAHKKWPNDVCAVVYQHKQFSWTHLIKNQTPKEGKHWETAKAIAKSVYDNQEDDFALGAVFYHADYVNPYWAKAYTKVTKIGAHIFYKKD